MLSSDQGYRKEPGRRPRPGSAYDAVALWRQQTKALTFWSCATDPSRVIPGHLLQRILLSILEIAETPNLAGEFLQGSARFSRSVHPLWTNAIPLAFEEIVHEFLTSKDRAISEIADLALHRLGDFQIMGLSILQPFLLLPGHRSILSLAPVRKIFVLLASVGEEELAILL